MVPRIILRQLARLRWRERWLRLTWGTTVSLAVVIALLALCCLIDWVIDRRRDTPQQLRVGMLVLQLVVWAGLAVVLLTWAFLRRVSDHDLALWVEDKSPQFGHRLISALQLNEPGADTRGMSPALIAATTREAEGEAKQVDFPSLADHRRLAWTRYLAFPVILLVVVMFAAFPETVWSLLARQFLANRQIPRSTALESVTRQVWPSGEEVTLSFLVRGKGLGADTQGEVRIEEEKTEAAEDRRPAERFPLLFAQAKSSHEAIYTARVPAGAANFTFRAWVRDGRTRKDARVELVPRPAVTDINAWVRLPGYTGLRPNGQPYEIPQPRGDVAGLKGSTALVEIITQKPIVKASLEVLGRPTPQILAALPVPCFDPPGSPLSAVHPWLASMAAVAPDPSTGLAAVQPGAAGPEMVLRRQELTIEDKHQTASGTFELRPGEDVYRIMVEDQYGFRNSDPPRRTIRLLTEEPPVVALLPERFPGEDDVGLPEDSDVEGIPLPLGRSLRVAYTAGSPYGLGKAQLVYRINEGEWWRLPLKEVAGSEKTGPFDQRRGAFINSKMNDQVEFHAKPSVDPERFPGRTDGGGRWDFQTRAMEDLKVGDKIEFFVEVFDRNPAAGRPPGHSETRQKTVVTEAEFISWIVQTLQQESRIRQLEVKQRRVFGVSDTTTDTPKTPRPPVTDPTPRPSGHVRLWHLIGPFPNPEDRGHEIPYPPEERVDLDKEYDGLKGKVRWNLFDSPTDKIDLEKYFSHSEAGVAYAACWVFSPQKQQAMLSTGSDDGIKVWLSRKLVLAKRVHREAVAGDDKTLIELEAGWNELLVKIDNKTGSWAFFLELQEWNTGRPLQNLRFRSRAPEDPRKYVRNWLLIGPFPNSGDNGRNMAYPPEQEPVDLDKEYDGIEGKVRWKPYQSTSGRISLDDAFKRPLEEANLSYAVCWVRNERDRPVILATGSHDGIRVWFNRNQKVDRPVHREASPGEDTIRVNLHPGWTEILVKVDNKMGRTAFFLELRDPETGRQLEDVEYRTSPPEKK